MTHLISGCPDRISRQTSTPLPSDNRTSSTATSGSANGISDRASTAVPASPTTSMSPLSSSSSLRPRRTTSWSSRTNTRVIYPPAPLGSACCAHRVKQTPPAGAEPARHKNGTDSAIPMQGSPCLPESRTAQLVSPQWICRTLQFRLAVLETASQNNPTDGTLLSTTVRGGAPQIAGSIASRTTAPTVVLCSSAVATTRPSFGRGSCLDGGRAPQVVTTSLPAVLPSSIAACASTI